MSDERHVEYFALEDDRAKVEARIRDLTHPACATCGKPATCLGRYEDMEHAEHACDECCGHGCEDGHCTPLEAP